MAHESGDNLRKCYFRISIKMIRICHKLLNSSINIFAFMFHTITICMNSFDYSAIVFLDKRFLGQFI